jgi:hypothetical protein
MVIGLQNMQLLSRLFYLQHVKHGDHMRSTFSFWFDGDNEPLELGM